jgi:hypothetical protein
MGTREQLERARPRRRTAWLARGGLSAVAMTCAGLWVTTLFGSQCFVASSQTVIGLTGGNVSLQHLPTKMAGQFDSTAPGDSVVRLGEHVSIGWYPNPYLGRALNPLTDFWWRPKLFDYDSTATRRARQAAGQTTVAYPGWWSLYFPLWIVSVVCAGPSFLAWRKHLRSRRIGKCKKCGYDLAGLNVVARCPECGHPRDSA